MKRKRTLIIVIVVVIAIMSFAATYAYANYFGPKTVLQANPSGIIAGISLSTLY
jgi:hypothetical protein